VTLGRWFRQHWLDLASRTSLIGIWMVVVVVYAASLPLQPLVFPFSAPTASSSARYLQKASTRTTNLLS
jgi:hypothetical protein